MTKTAPVKISTADLAALAYAAFRSNKDKVHNESSVFDRELDSLVAVTPNKSLMREGKLVVTDADRANAQDAINFVQQDVVVRMLKGTRVQEFHANLNKLIAQENCTLQDAGLMAYLPTVVEQIKTRQVREQEIAELSYTSQYLGRVGDKVTVNMTVISTRFITQFGFWAVDGKDDNGNLVSFLSGKEECTVSGCYSGKIKKTEPSSYHNGACVTSLNFVKKL